MIGRERGVPVGSFELYTSSLQTKFYELVVSNSGKTDNIQHPKEVQQECSFNRMFKTQKVAEGFERKKDNSLTVSSMRIQTRIQSLTTMTKAAALLVLRVFPRVILWITYL